VKYIELFFTHYINFGSSLNDMNPGLVITNYQLPITSPNRYDTALFGVIRYNMGGQDAHPTRVL
jgi:hypothetical protein